MKGFGCVNEYARLQSPTRFCDENTSDLPALLLTAATTHLGVCGLCSLK